MAGEMVERVARAIAAAEARIMLGNDDPNVGADPRALARAAIEAMREPTMHMKQEAGDTVVVGCCNLQLRDADEVWKVMIDAALE